MQGEEVVEEEEGGGEEMPYLGLVEWGEDKWDKGGKKELSTAWMVQSEGWKWWKHLMEKETLVGNLNFVLQYILPLLFPSHPLCIPP